MKIVYWIAAVIGMWAGPNVHGLAQEIGEAPDYAASVLGDGWDMGNEADLHPLTWVHNLSELYLDNGVLVGIPRDGDPHFWLRFPHIPSSLPTLEAAGKEIDADRFKVLSFYLWLPEDLVTGDASAVGRLVWHHGGDTVEAFDAGYSESALFPVYPGWHLYTFDLSELPPAKGQPWSGIVEGLRLDPCMGCREFRIAWARLAEKNQALIEAFTERLLVDDDTDDGNGFLTVIPRGEQSAFDLAPLPAGRYRMAFIDSLEYSLAERADLWDMESRDDLLWFGVNGWQDAAVGNGVFSGTTASPDPTLMLDVVDQRPIQAGVYRTLMVRMYVDQVPSHEPGMVIYWGAERGTVVGNSDFIPLQRGWHTYTVDLGRYPTWQGDIRALRIDPLGGGASGIRVMVDEVRLGRDPVSTEGAWEVVWSTGPLEINAAPKITILDPSPSSGQDYATTVLGNPWWMDDAADAPVSANLLTYDWDTAVPGLEGDFLHGISAPTSDVAGDPGVYVLFQENDRPLDADRFRLLAFSLFVPFDAHLQQELTEGAVARVAWKRDDWDPGLTTDDLVLVPGLHTYWLDMKRAVWEPASSRTWTGLVRYLRIDPFEFPRSREFWLGRIELRELPSVGGVLPLRFRIDDADSEAETVWVEMNGAVLAVIPDLPPGEHRRYLNLGTLPPGEVSLRLRVSDGLNNGEHTLPVPVMVRSGHSAPPPPRVDMLGPGSIALHWQRDANAQGYRLYYGLRAGVYRDYLDLDTSGEKTFSGVPAGIYHTALSRIEADGEESAMSEDLPIEVP